MKAITIWAPWAQCIARHGKDVENRDWPVPDSMVGEWVAIHVGKNTVEWKELMARVRRDDWEGIPEEVWNGLMAHYALCEADGATTSPPDSGRIIALACVRGTVDGTYNNTRTINGTLEDTMKAANSPWVTQGGLAHVYSPVLPLPRALVDDIGEVKGAQKYWNLDDSVAAKLTAFLEFAAASVEERIRSTALAVVAEPCDDDDCNDSTDRCPTCGYSVAGPTVAEDEGLDILGQFYCAAHLPFEVAAEPRPEQPQVDSDGVVQDDDSPPVRPSGDRYADPPESGTAEHGGIIGRYWCGETHIGATQVIGVGLWRVMFSAKDRPDGCHMGSPAPGELVQRKRKPDDASRHVDCFLVPKTWRSGSRGYDDLEAGELKEGDQGIVHLGMAEILTEQATASNDGKSELWRWSTVAKSTQGWVDVLLARGDLQMAFYLVQREIETPRQAPEPAPAPPAPPPPVAQQQLFPDPAPVAEAEPAPEPAPSTALQLGYTPQLADVVDADLVEMDPLYGTALLVARCLEGNGQMAMPFGWLLKALRQYYGAVGVDVEQVIDAVLSQPKVFDCNGDGRAIQSVRLLGSVAELQANVPAGAFHWVSPADDNAELLRAHLMRRAGRETVGNCRIYGTGPLRAWTDEKILTIARSSSDWFAVDGATVSLLYPDQAALDDICRKAFSDQAAEWLPTGTLTDVFARALKVNQPEAAAWVNRAVGESLCLRKRDKGFGYVWVEVANVAE